MALIGVLQTLVDGQIITAAQHNSNYSDIKTAFNTSAVLTDVAKTITVTHIWSAAQTFSGGFSLGAPVTSDLLFTDALYDIGKAGATRPRDLFLSRNLTVGGSLLSDLLFTDALYDIGKAGATRPRDGFFSRNLTVGAQLIVGGQLTLSNLLAVQFGLKAASSAQMVMGTTDANPLQLQVQNSTNLAMILQSIEVGIAVRELRLNPSGGLVTIGAGGLSVSPLNVGVGHFQAGVATVLGVGAGAIVTIYTATNATTGYLLVSGVNAGNTFLDTIAYDIPNAQVAVVTGNVLFGVPGARNYTIVGSAIRAYMSAMASTVKVVPIEVN